MRHKFNIKNYTSKYGESGILYIKNLKNLRIFYFPYNQRLIISGRIINFYGNIGRVTNFDDLLIGNPSLSLRSILNKINLKLLTYTTNMVYNNNFLDTYFNHESDRDYITNWNTSRVEYCINLKLESQKLVEAYILMFNLINLAKSDKRYTNFVLKNNLDFSSSCYIKSNGEYKENQKNRTTINFYNKYNQLQHKKKINAKYDTVTKKELNESKCILRLKVQQGSQSIYEVRKATGLSKSFKNFFDIDNAYGVISEKIKYFFGGADFYSYENAKRIIEKSDLTNIQKQNLIKALSNISKKQAQQLKTGKKVNYTFSQYYKKLLSLLNIHHILIPTEIQEDYLENPIYLIKNKRLLLK